MSEKKEEGKAWVHRTVNVEALEKELNDLVESGLTIFKVHYFTDVYSDRGVGVDRDMARVLAFDPSKVMEAYSRVQQQTLQQQIQAMTALAHKPISGSKL